ncbi:hypothetical protein SteCoe_25558 [Stentor coeruleus]|uniref:Uncharacterized protein n=1 Tax=Stentor coeruleus TaxID=5963 RepID=A0A1R2BF34_9CILI|nr:hypothetical protein SteCoe_25558 [Stentor coeruleus]
MGCCISSTIYPETGLDKEMLSTLIENSENKNDSLSKVSSSNSQIDYESDAISLSLPSYSNNTSYISWKNHVE